MAEPHREIKTYSTSVENKFDQDIQILCDRGAWVVMTAFSLVLLLRSLLAMVVVLASMEILGLIDLSWSLLLIVVVGDLLVGAAVGLAYFISNSKTKTS